MLKKDSCKLMNFVQIIIDGNIFHAKI